MAMQATDDQPSPSNSLLSRSTTTRLLKSLAATMPAGSDDPAAEDENRETARALFASLDPRDLAEAQLAAIAVAAAQSAMDNFARAAKPGVSDELAIRLRSNALAAGRTYATALRTLRKRPPAPAAGKPAAAKPAPAEAPAAARSAPTPAPIQGRDEFQPRDRFGKPIPTYLTQRMTRAQLLATLAWPRDPTLEAAAIAEEDASIADQATLEVPGNAAEVDADAGAG